MTAGHTLEFFAGRGFETHTWGKHPREGDFLKGDSVKARSGRCGTVIDIHFDQSVRRFDPRKITAVIVDFHDGRIPAYCYPSGLEKLSTHEHECARCGVAYSCEAHLNECERDPDLCRSCLAKNPKWKPPEYR